jgi:DNA-binding transcriptional regulator/RsmH inhibitor MraZ
MTEQVDLKGEFRMSITPDGHVYIPARLQVGFNGNQANLSLASEGCLVLYEPDFEPFFPIEDTVVVFLNNFKRIKLPEELRNRAELKSKAIFIGAGNRAEIWNPGKWRLFDESMRRYPLTQYITSRKLYKLRPNYPGLS